MPKSEKAPFIIYADPERVTEMIDGYKNNPDNSSTKKVSEHIWSGFSGRKNWKIHKLYSSNRKISYKNW